MGGTGSLIDPAPLGELLADGGRELVIRALREMPYAQYLCTAHWAAIRTETLKAAGYCCRLCDLPASDAHHMTYERMGCEQPGDTVALCRACHTIWHQTWIHKSHAELNRLSE